jgi:hypothetical protein
MGHDPFNFTDPANHTDRMPVAVLYILVLSVLVAFFTN